jgi:hypothetical protein
MTAHIPYPWSVRVHSTTAHSLRSCFIFGKSKYVHCDFRCLSALARAGGCLRSIRCANPPHAPRRIRFIWRSVRLAVAPGGDDYAFVPTVAPSSRTERLSYFLGAVVPVSC